MAVSPKLNGSGGVSSPFVGSASCGVRFESSGRITPSLRKITRSYSYIPSGRLSASGLADTEYAASSYPSVANSVFWFNWRDNIYQDVAGTLPSISNGNRVGCWKSVWGDNTPAVAVVDNDHYKPQLQGDGIQCDTPCILTLPSRLNVSGDYTLYFVSSRTDSDQYVMPMGENEPESFIDYGDTTGGCWADRNFYAGYQQSYAYFFGEYTTAKCIRRVRRYHPESEEFEILDDYYFLKVPGASEQSTTNARGTIKIDALLGRVGQYPAYTDAQARIHQIVFVARNIEPGSADDLAIIAKLLELEPDANW